jgi:hypothetical protein
VFYTIAASAISLFVGKLTYAYVAHKDPSKRLTLAMNFNNHSFRTEYGHSLAPSLVQAFASEHRAVAGQVIVSPQA